MRLWTIQSLDWYHHFLENGIIHGNRKYIDEDWEFCLPSYEWMMSKMDEKIGVRPFPECFPVWGWYQYDNAYKKKPDLRNAGFLPKGTKGVRLEINKNENNVLLSDFILWNIPFGYQSYIGANEEDSESFEKMLEEKSLDRKRFEDLPTMIQSEIIKSWDKVLDLDFDDSYYTILKANKSIQATFWSLSFDEVVKVDEFVAR